MSESHHPRQSQDGRRVVFWSWMTIIIVGLSIMIALPLAGR